MTELTGKQCKANWPDGMSMPSIRALEQAGITSLEDVAGRSERELATLHGMGTKGIRILKSALADRKLPPMT